MRMAKIGRWFMELKGDTGGHLLMWLLILGIAVLGAGFFVLTRYLLKNHLNLEEGMPDRFQGGRRGLRGAPLFFAGRRGIGRARSS